MRFSQRDLVFPLIAVSLYLLNLPPAAAQEHQSCNLSGAVVNSATNAGISHALVSFNGSASGFRFTDAGGNFQVVNVPCGTYSLMVSKPGFAPPRSLTQASNPMTRLMRTPQDSQPDQDTNRPTPSFEGVQLTAESEPARLQLVPLSSIQGTVLDENGEPLQGIVVEGISVKKLPDDTEYLPVRTARTDDRGAYALLNLIPGGYLVRLVGEGSSTRYFIGSTLNTNNDHRGLQPVYYPNADSVSSAQVFDLAPAQQARADFSRSSEPAFDINGHLAGFVAHAWTRIEIYREGDRLPMGAAFVNISNGQFRIVDVPRGHYTLRAMQYQADPAKWSASEVPVTIASQPVRDLVVELSSGVDIPVSVSYEAGAHAGERMELVLEPQHYRSNGRRVSIGELRQRAASVAGAGVLPPGPLSTQAAPPPQPAAFANVIPDQYRLQINLMGADIDYVDSAKFGDLDALNGPFTVAGAAAELHITMRGDSATIEGSVQRNGEPVMGAQIYVFLKSGSASRPKFGFSDRQGHFEVRGIPPGECRIEAYQGGPTMGAVDASAGESMTLQPNEHRTVTLEVISSSH